MYFTVFCLISIACVTLAQSTSENRTAVNWMQVPIPTEVMTVAPTLPLASQSPSPKIDRWIYVTESLGEADKFYLDSTYRELSNGNKIIWEKELFKSGAYVLNYMEFDCQLGIYRITHSIAYDRLGTSTSSDNLQHKWEYPVPDTVYEALFEKVCNVKKNDTLPPSNTAYRTSEPKPEPKKDIQNKDDLGVDYAIVTANLAKLREDADVTSRPIREIAKGDLVVLLSRNPIGSWFNVIHVKSNQEGWIHSSTVAIKYTKNRKPNLTIEGTNTRSSKNPTLEVKNDSDKTLTLKLGESRHVFLPRESKTITMSPARYSFHASAPNVIPDFGDQVFEVGYIYSWRFYIVTVRR